MEFPTIDKFAKEVAEKALDEITYEGKTIREWAEIIVKQQPCDDCVSREAVEKLKKYCLSYDTNTTIPKTDIFVKIADIKHLPSVTPSIPDVENDFNLGYNCGYADAMCDIGGED